MTLHLWESATPAATGAGAGTAHPKSIASVRLIPPARRNGPDTSREAARLIAGIAPRDRERILALIVSRGPAGATDDEGEAELGIKCQTYTPRRGELARLGWIVDSGRRRPTASGRPAVVWIACEHAERGGPPVGGGA